MIVGIDASNLGSGGARTHLWNLLHAAQPEKHGIRRVVVWGGRAILDPLEDRPWLEKVHVRALDGRLHARLLWQQIVLPRRAQSECDVLFVPGGNASARFRPLVAMSQNMLPFEPRESARYGWSWLRLKFRLLRGGQSRTFRHADGLVFLTEYARKVVARSVAIPPRTAVIPHGVESRFRLAPRPQHPISAYSTERPLRVLYVSIVDVYKHQCNVAAAGRILRDAGLPLAFDFVGPAYAPALARLRSELGTIDPSERFIRYRGPVPFARLHELHAAADMFVFASSCENMPNTLVEAMAAGLPIACSNKGPMPDVLGEGGVYFDPERPEEIASALRQLALDPTLRARCAAAASRIAMQYSWERCAQETLSFIAEVALAARGLAVRGAA